MSFRARLTLFFALIVVIPIVAIAFLVSEVAGGAASGKSDAALTEDLEIATARYSQGTREALRAGKAIARDAAVQAALRTGDTNALGDRIEVLAGEFDLVAYRLTGDFAAIAGPLENPDPFAAATIEIAGEPQAWLVVSTIELRRYLDAVAKITGEEVAVVRAGTVSGTIEIRAAAVPDPGEGADLAGDGENLRIVAAALPGAAQERVGLVAPAESGGFLASRPGIAALVAVFIAIAVLAATLIIRTLQDQIAAMLGAARRIGAGDFSGEVPVTGDDEMAGLATEFNEMRDRLAAQVEQLKRQRLEIEASVDKLGQAFASGLDRHALLGVLIETAVDATVAEYGLVTLGGGEGGEVEHGHATEELRDVALDAEHKVLRESGFASSAEGEAFAIASSLGKALGTAETLGAMTVARRSTPFSDSERSVFLYLAGQAAASVENLALHEMVSEQAVTDELTGLPNVRAFREAIAKEAARAARFTHDLSLVIIDLDDFKKVNDTHGHLQGDSVLRVVGRILEEESRGIDHPARYGGEEFVVALPETDAQGALEVAERIREKIEAEPMPLIGGEGEFRVTASLGSATMLGPEVEVRKLIAAADGALYEAKRTGKNRVRQAQGNGNGRRTDAQ